jgi:hypothetical protein
VRGVYEKEVDQCRCGGDRWSVREIGHLEKPIGLCIFRCKSEVYVPIPSDSQSVDCEKCD